MKIGILSDSHLKSDYTKEVIDFLKEINSEYLVHAGDLCVEKNLELLEESGLTYVASFKYNIKQEPYYFKIKETKFKLMHLPYHLTPDSDVVIFGHTHVFETDYKSNTLFINPGEVCAREKPLIECAQLEIKENEYIISRYFKNINEINFTKEEYKYERK
jgi:uncharacterized protein